MQPSIRAILLERTQALAQALKVIDPRVRPSHASAPHVQLGKLVANPRWLFDQEIENRNLPYVANICQCSSYCVVKRWFVGFALN